MLKRIDRKSYRRSNSALPPIASLWPSLEFIQPRSPFGLPRPKISSSSKASGSPFARLASLARSLLTRVLSSLISIKRIDRESYRRYRNLRTLHRHPVVAQALLGRCGIAYLISFKRKGLESYRRYRNLRTPLTSRRSLSLSNSHALWVLLRSSSRFASLRSAQLTLPLTLEMQCRT